MGMGSIYIGVSGLQAGQNALNTTAHNLTNVGTNGYVRQQIVQSDTLYNTLRYGAVSMQQVGLGTTVAQVRQVRDSFLDISYRLEAGRQGYYEVGYRSYYEIETLLGTLEGAQFSGSLESLSEAINEVSKDPSDSSRIALLKQNAVKFMDNAKDVYEKLGEYQDNLNEQVSDTVDRINVLATSISELNKQIVKVEAGKVESANDLRDARNLALDELAGLIKISYSEDSSGYVSVSAEEVPLVGDGYLYAMGTSVDKATGFMTPVWVQYDNTPVYNLSSTIDTENNTDVGKLKALLLHRGDSVTDYTDIPVESKYQDGSGKWATGNWTIDGKAYTNGEKAYDAAVNYYNNNISASSLMNTMAEFDQLINGITTAINDALCPNTSMTIAGTEGYTWKDENGVALAAGSYTCLDLENCTMSADGVVGTELFSRQGIDRYTKYYYTDAAGEEHTCYIYNEPDESSKNTLYSVENLEVNQAFEDDPGLFPGYTLSGEVAHSLGEKLAELFTTEFASLNPNSTAKATFDNYFSKLIIEVGIYGNIYGKIASSEQATVDSIDGDRQMVIGVSSDEELSNMIKFQNAYNASSRYINVVSEMLEHIITQLGS